MSAAAVLPHHDEATFAMPSDRLSPRSSALSTARRRRHNLCYPCRSGASQGAKDTGMTLDQEPLDSATGWVKDHVHRYIETNGEDGHMWRGAPTLILTTVGRKSGKARRQALIYGR